MTKRANILVKNKSEVFLDSKMSWLKNLCENFKIFMISVYSIEEKSFLLVSNNFDSVFGTSYHQFKNEGWDVWYSMVHPKETVDIKNGISNFLDNCLMDCKWFNRYHIKAEKEYIFLNHEIEVCEIEGKPIAVNYLLDISDMERIESHFNTFGSFDTTPFLEKKRIVLSERQKQILNLISDGYSSKEIGDLLCISNHTVLFHRKNLISKFNAKNSAQLIKRACCYFSGYLGKKPLELGMVGSIRSH